MTIFCHGNLGVQVPSLNIRPKSDIIICQRIWEYSFWVISRCLKTGAYGQVVAPCCVNTSLIHIASLGKQQSQVDRSGRVSHKGAIG